MNSAQRKAQGLRPARRFPRNRDEIPGMPPIETRAVEVLIATIRPVCQPDLREIKLAPLRKDAGEGDEVEAKGASLRKVWCNRLGGDAGG